MTVTHGGQSNRVGARIFTASFGTPAMAAGVTTRLFDVMDLVNLLVESEKTAA